MWRDADVGVLEDHSLHLVQRERISLVNIGNHLFVSLFMTGGHNQGPENMEGTMSRVGTEPASQSHGHKVSGRETLLVRDCGDHAVRTLARRDAT